jgi:hypothetical protein
MSHGVKVCLQNLPVTLQQPHTGLQKWENWLVHMQQLHRYAKRGSRAPSVGAHTSLHSRGTQAPSQMPVCLCCLSDRACIISSMRSSSRADVSMPSAVYPSYMPRRL